MLFVVVPATDFAFFIAAFHTPAPCYWWNCSGSELFRVLPPRFLFFEHQAMLNRQLCGVLFLIFLDLSKIIVRLVRDVLSFGVLCVLHGGVSLIDTRRCIGQRFIAVV